MRFRAVVIAFGLAICLASTARAQQPGFGAGTDILYLRPTFSDNPSNTTRQFQWGAERSHAVWAGYTLESGWGIRYNAFLFDGDATKQQLDLDTPAGISTPAAAWPYGISSPSAVLSAGLGQDRLWFRSNLRILKEELEGTYGWWEDDWSVQLSAGVRYQLLRQNYNADLSNTGDGVTMESLALRTSHEFTGFGPTVGLFGSYRFAESWSVYGKIRGAIAFGREDRQSIHSESLTDPKWSSAQARLGQQPAGCRCTILITELKWVSNGTDLTVHVYSWRNWPNHISTPAGRQVAANLNMFGGQFCVALLPTLIHRAPRMSTLTAFTSLRNHVRAAVRGLIN